jgi:hypothetical protein
MSGKGVESAGVKTEGVKVPLLGLKEAGDREAGDREVRIGADAPSDNPQGPGEEVLTLTIGS